MANQKTFTTHGDGRFKLSQFKSIGENVVFEPGVLVFHPENIIIEDNVYIGHYAILKGYYQNQMVIGENTWIGQACFFHSAGGIRIGKNVGIGPGVKVITSYHKEEGIDIPILFSAKEFKPVVIGDDSDIGTGAIILPGRTIGRGAQIGAGSVVTKDVVDYAVAAGNPAKLLRNRTV